MKKIFRRKNEINELKNYINCLDEFIQNNKINNLTAEQSKKNIEEGLIEIICKNNHSSNGLLISDNGYFLTAKHCITPRSDLKIRLYNNEVYNIEKVCAVSKEKNIEDISFSDKLKKDIDASFLNKEKKIDKDIALVKADIPGECKPKNYKFFNENSSIWGSNLQKNYLVLLSRRNGEIITKGGSIPIKRKENIILFENETNRLFLNQFKIYTSPKPGDSGGAIVNLNGELIGLLSCGQDNQESNYASGIKLSTALNLIYFYAKKLDKNSVI